MKKKYRETEKKILLDMNNKKLYLKLLEFTVKLPLFQPTKNRANINKIRKNISVRNK